MTTGSAPHSKSFVKRHVRFFTFSVLVLFFFVYLPAIYTLSMVVPQFEEMHRSAGSLSYTRHPNSRGAKMVLVDGKTGTRIVLSCKNYVMEHNNCPGHGETGEDVVVSWFEFPLHPFETVNHPAQIEISGRVVMTVEQTETRLAWSRSQLPRYLGIPTFIFLVVMTVIYLTDRKIRITNQESPE